MRTNEHGEVVLSPDELQRFNKLDEIIKRREKEKLTYVYEWSEIKKLVDAIYEKKTTSWCDGLPYRPKPIKVQLIAKEK